MTEAEGYLTVLPPPMIRKFPDRFPPACWDVPLNVPPPSAGSGYVQLPAHFPVTFTVGGAVGVEAHPVIVAIAPMSSNEATKRMTLLPLASDGGRSIGAAQQRVGRLLG